MNAIKLTTEQKDKLLEMCRVLFPEYRWIQFKPHNKSTLQFCINAEDRDEIHWFEFCMTHLINKLSKKFAETEDEHELCLKDEFYSLLGSNFKIKIRPVDYLYKEFLKLKNVINR